MLIEMGSPFQVPASSVTCSQAGQRTADSVPSTTCGRDTNEEAGSMLLTLPPTMLASSPMTSATSSMLTSVASIMRNAAAASRAAGVEQVTTTWPLQPPVMDTEATMPAGAAATSFGINGATPSGSRYEDQ